MSAFHEDLIGRLRSWWPPTRRDAAQRLGREGVREAVVPLIGLLQDWNWDVRQAAAEALGRLGDPRAIEPLRAAWAAGDPQMRSVAAVALARLGHSESASVLVRMLGDPASAILAWDALLKMGSAAIPHLVRELELERDPDRRRTLGDMVSRFGDSAIPEVTLLLTHRDPRLRAEGARILGAVGDRSVVDQLIRLLGDPVHEVRVEAGKALDRLGEGFLADAVRGALLGSMQVLRRRPDPRAVAPLLRRLDDPSETIREGAAQALGILGDRAAVEPLIDLLGDPSVLVRTVAAWSLKELGERGLAEAVPAALRAHRDPLAALRDPRAVRPLVRALANHVMEPDARDALVMLGEGSVRPVVEALLNRSVDVENATEVLSRIGAATVGPLVEALRHPESDARRKAAQALGAVGHPSAIPALAEALDDPDIRVRAAAMTALVTTGRLSVEALLEVLGSGSFAARAAAAEGLGRIGDPRALQPLIGALDHPNAGTRAAAAEALGRLGHVAGAALVHLERRADDERNAEVRHSCRQAVQAIRKALAGAPSELEAASAPEGRGTEPEAASAPPGRGTELEADA